MYRSVLFASALLLMISCVRREEPVFSTGAEKAHVRITATETKTSISGNSVVFKSSDKIKLICENFNQSVLSNDLTQSVNVFEGEMNIKRLHGKDCSWYTVYPSTATVSQGVVTGKLPSLQKAPFDQEANFMYSDLVIADYDEKQLPDLSFQMNLMMGLVRLSFSCSNPDYSNDIIKSVQIQSSEYLTGDFTFDLHNPCVNLTSNRHKYVSASFPESEKLGTGTVHSVNLFVAPGIIADITLTVKTDSHTFTYTSDKSFETAAGKLSLLPAFDLSSWTVSGDSGSTKRVVCWGSSVVNGKYTFTTYLQELLGTGWVVYNGGCSGDKSYEVAARQGANPIVTGSEFTIPADTGNKRVDGLLSTNSVYGEPKLYPLRAFRGFLRNPCKLVGTNGEEVTCEITSYFETADNGNGGKDTTYYANVRRLSPGNPVVIAEHTPVETYAARELRDADLSILYFGGNDGHRNFNTIVDWHNRMLDYTAHPGDHIVVGYYMYPGWERNGYSDIMGAAFCDRFLNQRIDVTQSKESLKYWLLWSGAYPDEASIPESEYELAAKGYWPLAFQISESDNHPNVYGCKVTAKLIYERMKILGYLDD